ncbi:MAG TPA: cytochrome b [Rudaea sp.]|jgi:cytochrome b561|nr:cytochrome b [Rudaea sp.]
MLKSDRDHWGSLAKFFHWTIVLLILAQGTVGLIMVGLPKRPNVIPVYNFHKSVGLTILALAVLRLIWRLFDRRPEEPASMPRAQVIAAKSWHALLYVLIFLVPLSGWWMDSVSALRPLYWFGLFQVPPLGGPDPTHPDLKNIAAGFHVFLFWTLVVVAAGHAVAALYHQFAVRDGVLARMWPAALQRKRSPPSSVSLEATFVPPTLPEVSDAPTPTNPVVADPVRSAPAKRDGA